MKKKIIFKMPKVSRSIFPLINTEEIQRCIYIQDNSYGKYYDLMVNKMIKSLNWIQRH